MDTPPQRYYKIDLIGDSCTDVYHYGVCERLSPEAPVPILKETRRIDCPGMSWNVRLNIESFGATVEHYTNSEKIYKHRFIDNRYNQHLLRWDEGENQKVKKMDINLLKKELPPDAVVISDYEKGFLPPEVCKEIIQHYKTMAPDIPIFVDTKKTNLSCFEGAYIKINEKEYNSVEVFPENGKIITTLGEKGARYDGIIYPIKTVEVFDVCGAGDVFLSSLAIKYLENKSISEAIEFANRMASISVTHMGTYILREQDINQIKEVEV